MKTITITVLFLIFATPWLWSKQTLSLKDALTIAFENSPDIRLSKLRLEQIQHSLDAQNASLKTYVNLGFVPFEYSNSNYVNYINTSNGKIKTKVENGTLSSRGFFSILQPIKWTDGVLIYDQQVGLLKNWYNLNPDTWNTGNKSDLTNVYHTISFYQPIFTHNRTKLRLKEIELDYEHASLNHVISKLSLEKIVTRDYYFAWYYKMTLEILEQMSDTLKQCYLATKEKVDAGMAIDEELIQIEMQLEIIQSDFRFYFVLFNNALDALKKLIGLPISEEIDIYAGNEPTEIIFDQEKAIDHGLKNRIELRQREIEIEESLFELTRSSSLNEFKGSISLSYGIRGQGMDFGFDDTYNDLNKDQKVVLSFDIPLFDWGRRKSSIKAAEKFIESNRIEAQDEKNDIIISIRQACRELENQILETKATLKIEKKSEITFNRFFKRYKNENLSSMMLTLYLKQFLNQKINYIIALMEYRLAALDLKIQSLWDFEKNKSVLPLNEK